MKSLLTFNHDHSERREITPPMLRIDVIGRSVAGITNVIGLEKSAKQTRAEERYGKVASQQIFGTKWDNYRAHKAAEAESDPFVPQKPAEKAYSTADSVHKTILDDEVSIDQFQFDAMAAEKQSDTVPAIPSANPQADAVEAELQNIIEQQHVKDLDSMLEASRKKAFASATPIGEANERLTETA